MNVPLPWLDVCVIAFYLIGITWLGLSLGKKLEQGADYFMPRRFGKGMMMMHAFYCIAWVGAGCCTLEEG